MSETIIRRDPRTERILRNRLHALHEQLTSLAGEVRGPSGLVRKNPHALGFIGPNGIKRIDRFQKNSANALTGRSKTHQRQDEQLPLHSVADPDFHIVVVPDMVGGRLTSQDRDILGLAHRLSAATPGKGAVMAVVFGEHMESSFEEAGVDRLLHVDGEEYQGYCPELQLSVLADVENHFTPEYWLFPDSIYGGGDLGSRLAAKLGERPAVQAWRVTREKAVCRGASGSMDIERSTPRVLLLAEECADAIDETRHEALPAALDLSSTAPAPALSDYGLESIDPNAVPLGEAEFILAAGNGVKNWELFHQAARELGATEAASRVAVDNGHMPRSRQVGATGTWVTARVYLAVGISGAVQHMQGIGQCETVVAINTDPGCDMVKRASLSVIGDSEEVLAELLALTQEHKNGVSDAA